MDLHDYLEVIRRRWISAVIVALTTTALAAVSILITTPQYTATTRLFFAVGSTTTISELAQGSNFAEKQMTSYAEVATSPKVLDPVIRELDLQRSSAALARALTATIPPETVILEISATDPDPKLAAAIANAVGDQVAQVAKELTAGKTTATSVADALVPTRPSSPNVARNLALGVALGILLGLGVAMIRHLVDTRVRSEQDVRSVTESPLLGTIGYDDKVPSHPLILRDEPLSAAAEAIRRLRTNLQFTAVGDRPRSIVITSSIPSEGKSTTSLNLAVALADAGSRVILVDADLRRPSVASSMGLEGQVGLTTVLIGRAEVEDVVQHWAGTSLDVLPAGRIPPNPSELLGSTAMERLLDQLTARYDVVLLDSPPVLPVTDAAVLSKLAGGTLVIVGADRVHRPQLRESLEALATAGAYIHGVVLNRMARQESGAYSYYSGYAPTEAPGTDTGANPVSPSGSPRILTAAATPKRARVEAPRQPTPVPVNGSSVLRPTAIDHSAANGAEPASVRRATPVGS
jgi:capsular exopolysaccharide synthesis family protein